MFLLSSNSLAAYGQTIGIPAAKPEAGELPPVVSPDKKERITSPADANKPQPISPTEIIEAVRHPEAGIEAITAALPSDGLSNIHLNATVKGNQRSAIEAAADQRQRQIQQMSKAVEARGWLAFKLKQMNVDPTTLIGVTRSKAGALVAITH